MHALFMLHPWLAIAAWTAFVIFGQVQVPDAGGAPAGDPAGSGGDPAPDPVDDGAGGGAPADRTAAAGGAADDDLDDDERELPEDVRNDPKRLRTRYRRLQRQFGPAARIAERFRGADGRYLSPEQIDRLRSRAQDMDDVQALLDAHPDITQLMLERRRTGAPAAADPADTWQDPYAEPDKLPFDPAHESSQWFLNEFRRLDKTNHELRQALKRVEQGVGGVTEREQQRTAQQLENTWKDQTLAAARSASLKGEDLEDFVNTVYANFRAAKAEQRLDKIDRKQIIDRALRVFKRTRAAGDRQTAAAAHTRADGNRALPAPHSRAAAGPAHPTDTNRAGTLKDARKNFFERIGMTAPPGVR